ncbi:MAG: hypothetical protein GY913_26465 [Proteobacteria bacterium]|nr:hypothetical protein [Pseudomonadota bacterium]
MQLVWITSALAGFGGAELGVLGETDEGGGEVLLDVAVVPFTVERDRMELSWGSTDVGWSVMAPEDAQRFDRLELSVVEGHVGFGSGTSHATFQTGSFTWDPEDGAMELGLVGGGMGGVLLDERLRWGVGGDLHARRVSEASSLLLGLPMEVALSQPLPYRTFAQGGVMLRPSFGLVGEQAGSFDGLLTAEVGVHAVDEAEATLDIVLGYEGRLDTYTVRASPVTQRVGIGARASF